MEGSLFASLNWEASLAFSSPPRLILEQVLLHPTPTFPRILLLFAAEVRAGLCHPDLSYCCILLLTGLPAPSQRTPDSLVFPPAADFPPPFPSFSLQYLSQYFSLPPSPLFSKILP